MSEIGRNIRLSVYGASHAPTIGMTLSGLPKGLRIDLDALQRFVNRRKSVLAAYSTSRREDDIVLIRSGIEDGLTTGEEIRAEIENKTARRGDYDELKYTPRPSHADYAARMKCGMDIDLSGGGEFSGRMTAAICMAGGIAEQILDQEGIAIGAYVSEIGGIGCGSYRDEVPTVQKLQEIKCAFPMLNDDSREEINHLIAQTAAQGDSIGGVVEGVAINVPVGKGGSLFDGAEALIASYLLAIPAVKGVEFGLGFGLCALTGSRANDEFYYDGDDVKTYTNNSGGINGGISNGMPITVRVAFRPTPSISKEQRTVNLLAKENTTISIKGRHDACIVPRAAAAVEAALALAILDLTR